MVYSSQKSTNQTRHKNNRKNKNPGYTILWAVLPIIFILGLGTGYLIWGKAQAVPTQDSANNPTRYEVSVDDDPFIGPENAPVTIIMFSDYQCSYCKKWYQEVFQSLMSNYSGLIRFVYRDFPLYSIHPSASSAAEAANCAGDQNKYWDYFNAIFNDSGSLSDSSIQSYAENINLNMDQFNQCLTSRKYRSEVESDYSYAAALGIQSTPTFFINGIAIVGAQPYQVFSTIIEQELNN